MRNFTTYSPKTKNTAKLKTFLTAEQHQKTSRHSSHSSLLTVAGMSQNSDHPPLKTLITCSIKHEFRLLGAFLISQLQVISALG